MTKRKTFKIDLGGQKIEVTRCPDLFTDLGALLFFGVVTRKAIDQGNNEGMVYAGATMAEFAKRCLRRVEAERERGMEAHMYIAWAEVLQ